MSEFYCPLPFRHAYIDSTGIAACCQTPRYQVSLDQWFSHPALIQLQKDLLEGNQPKVCQGCVQREKNYGTSLRMDALQDYNNQRFEDTEFDFVDFRSVNICNFKCRSCDPTFSHGIAQEVKHNPVLQKFFNPVASDKVVHVTDQNVKWIRNNLAQLKRLMFTGGEPTVIPEVRDLISYIKHEHPNIMVMITSNASFEDDFWFKITHELPNLHWTVSIDAVGTAAEIVRHGSDWSVIEHNVAWLAKNASSMNINSVVTNLTVFGLKPLLQWGTKMQALSAAPDSRQGDLGCRHQFHVCQRPYHLAADNLPPDLLVTAAEYLRSIEDLDLDCEQRQMLEGLIKQINGAEFDLNLWQRAQLYNETLDQLRNQNHRILFEAQT